MEDKNMPQGAQNSPISSTIERPKKTSAVEDESWIERLYSWSDMNDLPEPKWIPPMGPGSLQGFWEGIPRDKEQLINCKHLSISDLPDNVELPEEIGMLTNLISLTVCCEFIRKIPAEIGLLISLEELDFQCCYHLKELPSEIGKLINLKNLQLRGNSFEKIPSTIGRMKSLEVIDLTENELTSIPDEIGQLEKLIDLHLSKNPLKTLPSSISNLKELRCLYVYGNSELIIPDEINQLPNNPVIWDAW